MFVRLVRFSFGPGKQAAAQNLANDLVPAIQARPGCQAVTFFGDDSDGEHGLYVLWASQEDADAAATNRSEILPVHKSEAGPRG